MLGALKIWIIAKNGGFAVFKSWAHHDVFGAFATF
jgi:hypothetical protein